MSSTLGTVLRERAFAPALVSSVVVLLFGGKLLHGLSLDGWTGGLGSTTTCRAS